MNSVPTSHAVMLGIGIGLLLAFLTMQGCARPNVMKEAPGPVAAVCDPARPWECVKPVRPVSLAPATVPAKGQRARVFPK